MKYIRIEYIRIHANRPAIRSIQSIIIESGSIRSIRIFVKIFDLFDLFNFFNLSEYMVVKIK